MDAAKAPTPGQRPEDLHLAVLTLSEGLVQTPIACWTHLHGTSISFTDWDQSTQSPPFSTTSRLLSCA